MELQIEHSAQNWGSKTGTKRSRCSSAKLERKINERNRRNHMKNLYSMLNSLLSHRNSKELLNLTLPEQIDEAVDYIKILQTRLREFREKKDFLIGTKRSYKRADRDSAVEIRINESGSAMEVALTTEPGDCQFSFREMIRVFHDDGGEVVSANFWVVGNRVFHIVRAEIGSLGAAKTIKEKLNKFVNGSRGSEEEVEQEQSSD
ncbi:hypothetical protein like AT4G20970 [Hibiscus trionum]|uniref:BHLH domain-containing protein n=1 Tax=Hibiscus trionum TaxID=183268 RepID=A0A9W7MH13_HIBTR|nr:hypothetical protein like AT4G20970 [Hibiscus trionum]